jgi:toxin secretion/phage lysis holin
MDEKEVKGLIGLIVGVFSYLTGRINELVVVLVAFMILDYIFGVAAAFVEKRLESRKSFIGIIKKVGYMALLAMAFFIDYVILYMAETAGITLPIKGLFGIATCCWLIATEGLSILEKLNMIGVPYPPFLKKAFTRLRKSSEDVTKEGK